MFILFFFDVLNFCYVECLFGLFGINCFGKCKGFCRDLCNYISGICDNGCLDGWLGLYCD